METNFGLDSEMISGFFVVQRAGIWPQVASREFPWNRSVPVKEIGREEYGRAELCYIRSILSLT